MCVFRWRHHRSLWAQMAGIKSRKCRPYAAIKVALSMFLINSQPLTATEAGINGFWLDHPDKYIPPDNICNAFAETQMTTLKNEGLNPYYVAMLTPTGEGHAGVGVDEKDGTYIFDNLHQEREVPASQFLDEGYLFLAREINGVWYSVTAKLDE